ncbi:MAG: response regulator transcription factor [Syntrophorhabdales bacterium]|jgi:DNA-binding NarL/FixJ family response regulator
MTISVLLADDHRVVREGLRALLERNHDISVVAEASDGQEAVKLAATIKPDVVVMDISMPVLNGIEATQQVIEASPSSRVIILSMYSTSEHIFRAFKAGAQGYLLKESAGSDVVAAVRAVKEGRRYLTEKITETVLDDFIHRRALSESESPVSRLSKRERHILQLVVEGKSSSDIGRQLFLSPKTIDTYRSRIMHKLSINDVPGLVKFVLQHGLTALE